jgi:hypothetical protein
MNVNEHSVAESRGDVKAKMLLDRLVVVTYNRAMSPFFS